MRKELRIGIIIAAVLICIALSTPSTIAGTDGSNIIYPPFKWSGYYWVYEKEVGPVGPGNNFWNSKNVWLDNSTKEVHLKISKNGDRWDCAEIQTNESLGRGTYQFWVDSPLGNLDENVVLGLFNSPPTNSSETHEIDIEFAHFWNYSTHNAGYTIWKDINDPKNTSARLPHEFTFNSTEHNTIHGFNWSRDQVNFWSMDSHNESYPFSNPQYVAQIAMPMHINLWLRNDSKPPYNPMPPIDGKPIELVIKKFEFIPEDNPTSRPF